MVKNDTGETSTKNTKVNGKKRVRKKSVKIIALVAALAVVLLAGGLCYTLLNRQLNSLISVYDQSENKSVIYLNSKKIDSVAGNVLLYSNMDRSAFYITDANGGVYYVKGKKLERIMNDCTYLVVANHDKTALLINKDNALFRYDGSKMSEITDEFVFNITLSGDGSYYAYTVSGENDKDVSYIGTKPENETKIDGVSIYAMSETGEYLYGKNEDGNLLRINKKGEQEILAESLDMVDSARSWLYLNEDGTEIMFSEDNKIWVSADKTEKKKVADRSSFTVYGRETGNTYNHMYSSSADTIFCPIDTFKNSVVESYYSNNSRSDIYLLSDNYESSQLVEGATYICKMDKKASGLYYIKDEDLCYIEIKKDAKERVIAEQAEYSGIYVSDDCKDVYLVNYNEGIYYIKDAKAAKQVDVDLKFLGTEYGAIAGGKLYKKIDNEFYYINGTKAKTLKDMDGVEYDEHADILYAYDRDGIYELKNGKAKKLKGEFKKAVSINVLY